MFCFIYKWFIPDMIVAGKELSPLFRHIERHVRHCDCCREFATATLALNLKLTQDTDHLLHDSPGIFAKELNKKISEKISEKITTASTPPIPFVFGSHMVRSLFKLIKRPVFSLPPIWAPALALAVIVVILISVPRTPPPRPVQRLPQHRPVPITMPRLPINGATIQKLSLTVQSSFQAEIRSLEDAVQSTREFLGANLPVQL